MQSLTRTRCRPPVVVLCGDGGSGKDTVASIIKSHWNIPYHCSTSYVAAEKMWEQVKEWRFFRLNRQNPCPYPVLEQYNINPSVWGCLENFYNDRANYRRFWADWIDCYNKTSDTGAQLYLDAVSIGNFILTGIRKVNEFHNFQKTGVPDLSIWVSRPGIPRDPTQEFGPELCDFIIENNGSVSALNDKVLRLTGFIKKMGEGLL